MPEANLAEGCRPHYERFFVTICMLAYPLADICIIPPRILHNTRGAEPPNTYSDLRDKVGAERSNREVKMLPGEEEPPLSEYAMSVVFLNFIP